MASTRRVRQSKKLFSRRKSAGGASISGGALMSALWFVFLSLTLWLLWAQWAEVGSKGALGRLVSAVLYQIFGHSGYFFPPLFLYGLVCFVKKKKKTFIGVATLSSSIFLVLAGISSFIEVLKTIFEKSSMDGGVVGAFIERHITAAAGKFGCAVFSLIAVWIGLHILFRISWLDAFHSFLSALKNDYDAWLSARAELKQKKRETAEKKIREAEQEKPAPSITRKSENGAVIVRAERKKQTAGDKKNDIPLPPKGEFSPAPLDLLAAVPADRIVGPSDEEIENATHKLEDTLKSFEISASVAGAVAGPVVTRYEVSPDRGVRVSSIVSLSNDIALAMKAQGIRVEAPIPGKDAIGFEIPNEKPAMVYLREILDSDEFKRLKSHLAVGLGRFADGAIAVANLEKMPHLLVAGATNSGKSICLQSIIVSILTHAKPDEVKFLMIDPKRLELTFYENIPHLYDPKVRCEEVSVITDPNGAAKSLKCLVKEMERRYKAFELAKVKNIAGYNKWAEKNNQEKCFYIVVVIDELADLMLQTRAAVEDSIQRLAQMARAVGIHLVLCTQRPSVNVITGVIKANLPSRIAMQVASKTDSRVILDTLGAEALLGKGDMLYLAIDAQRPSRIQGAYVSEEEITRIADYLRAQGVPSYSQPYTEDTENALADRSGVKPEELKSALELITERRRISQDLLKAHFGSSARATNILSVLEMEGYISKPEGSNRWEIQFDKVEYQLSTMKQKTALDEAFK